MKSKIAFFAVLLMFCVTAYVYAPIHCDGLSVCSEAGNENCGKLCGYDAED